MQTPTDVHGRYGVAARVKDFAGRAALITCAFLAGCGTAESESKKIALPPKPKLAVMTSLPLFWSESGAGTSFIPEPSQDVFALLLRGQYELVPVDYLDDSEDSAIRISDHKLLLLAQTGALGPGELVVLDTWVRNGGRVMIFADPLLDWPSRYPLGDNRRPQGATLLSPLFAHWGLELTFDPDSDGGLIRWSGRPSPMVESPGRFKVVEGDDCRVDLDGLRAKCVLGRGRATIIADSDLLKPGLIESSQNQGFVETNMFDLFSRRSSVKDK